MKHPELWGSLRSRYETTQPRKMLALDGGGIRGALTLGVLKKIEDLVGPLHAFFDYIAGTSTGAIIAAGLARGMSVDELTVFYRQTGPAMFQRTRFLDRLHSLYRNGPLETQLRATFGDEATLSCTSEGQADHLKTLLLVVTRNASTDSPWPISSNPEARYNEPGRNDCNLRIPLWKLVRASTAAPVFFPPEVVQWDKNDPTKAFVFVDGGVTPYNNPAFALFRLATDPAYRLGWSRGEDQLLLISVGTGAAPSAGLTADDPSSNLVSTGIGIPTALMYGALVDQDVNCRTVGRCTHGGVIDRELLDMVPREGPDTGSVDERLRRPEVPLSQDLGRAFLYARYNAELSRAGLAALGLAQIDLDAVQKLDNVSPANIDLLFDIGAAVGAEVKKSHFGPFIA